MGNNNNDDNNKNNNNNNEYGHAAQSALQHTLHQANTYHETDVKVRAENQ